MALPTCAHLSRKNAELWLRFFVLNILCLNKFQTSVN
jgi:hypothetical protein